MLMKAAILVEQKKPLVIADIEIPDDLEYGQVLVKVVCSGICGSQIGEIDGVKGPDRFLPHLLGHEGGGVVLETGPGVTKVKKDDHVVLHWRKGFGIESPAPKYRWDNREINAGLITTFNEYAIVSENRLTPLPANFSLKQAPLFGCAVTTAMGVVNNDARIKIGQSVIIFGVGGVGMNIAQAAEMVSAYPIIGIDVFDSKIKMARKFGITHEFNSTKTSNLNEEIINIVGKEGADVVIDTTGSARVIEQAYELTHPDGRTILVGVPRKGDNISIYSLPLHFNKTLTGSHGGNSIPDVEIPRYIRLINAGKMTLDGLITHEFSLDKVNEALDTIQKGEAGRCVINMRDCKDA